MYINEIDDSWYAYITRSTLSPLSDRQARRLFTTVTSSSLCTVTIFFRFLGVQYEVLAPLFLGRL
jgi:hypothetical protein